MSSSDGRPRRALARWRRSARKVSTSAVRRRHSSSATMAASNALTASSSRRARTARVRSASRRRSSGFSTIVAGAQLWKQNNVSNRVLIGQQHGDPIDAHAQAAGGRHAMFHRRQIVLVEWLGFDVARFTRAYLLHKPLALDAWIVQLGKRVGDFDASGERLEAFDLVGIVRLALGQGGARKVR